MRTRLDELVNLNHHWLNGKGVAPNRTHLMALAEEFERNFDTSLPLPHLYPTPEGSVFAEWTIGEWAVSLEIEIATLTARYEALNLKSDASSELSLHLNEHSGWTSLNQELRFLVSR